MSGIRCFLGIPLADDVAQALLEASAVLRTTDPAWQGEKWVRPENLHITVKFLGDLEDDDLETFCAHTAEEVAVVGAFELPFTGLRAMGGLRRCRMLWGSFADPDRRAEALHRTVDAIAVQSGVAADSRKFTPHATLCRARRAKTLASDALEAAQDVLDQGPDSMSVVSVSVFSSRLTPRGPIYREIGAWRLRGE